MRTLAQAWGGFFAGIAAFFLVVGMTGYLLELLHVNYSLMEDIVLFLVGATAGAYVCARIAKPAPLFMCLCLGVPGAVLSWAALVVSVPDWFFYARAFACLLGTLIGWAIATRRFPHLLLPREISGTVTRQIKTNSLPCLFALAVNASLMLAPAARAQDTAKPPAEKWHLKDSCRQVQLEPTAIVSSVRRIMTPTLIHANYTCSESSSTVQNSDRESIPLAAITDIVREEVTRKPVEDEINRSLTAISPENVFSTILDAAGAQSGAVAAPAVLLAEAAALAPFHGVKTHQS